MASGVGITVTPPPQVGQNLPVIKGIHVWCVSATDQSWT